MYISEQLLILLVVAAITILCLTRTWAGLILLLFLAPFYGFFRYTVGLSGIQTLWKEFMVILLTTGLLINKVVIKKERLVSSPANLPLLLFLFVAIIQLLRAPSIGQGLFGLRILATYIPIYFVAANLRLTKKQIQSVVFMTLAIGVVTAVYAMWQQSLGLNRLSTMGLANVGSNLAAMGQLRVFSTFAGPEYFGLYLVLGIILGAALLVTKLPKRKKIVLTIGISIMFIGLIYTLVRIDWFLLGVGLIFLSVLAKNPRFVVLLSLAIIAVVVIFPPFVKQRATITFGAEDYSFAGRKINYFEWNIPNILRHPLGVGLGETSGRVVYMRVTGRSQESELIGGGSTESGFANVALELGILGLIFLLWFFVRIIKHGLNIFYRLTDPFLKWLAAAIVVFITLIALGNVVGPMMEVFPAGDLYFWFLVGLLVRLESVQKRRLSIYPKFRIGGSSQC